MEQTLPPPVGGWNTSKSLASMEPADAVELVNFFPRPTHVESRLGSQQHRIIQQRKIKTLAVFRDIDGAETMLAATNTGIFDASDPGSIVPETSTASLATCTNGRFQWDQFGDGTNNWLILVNGVDKPVYYNGSTAVLVDGASSPAITGITTTNIVHLGVFKERLFFIRSGVLGFDFLPAGAAGGAVSHFDLSSVANLGGYLMAMAVWSRDAGDGPDDYAVFITSQGEALVYSGTDPSSATTWSLVGTFRISRPVGRKCVLKYGADPLILTESGLFPLSSLLASGDERARFAISYKIQSAFSEASRQTVNTYGWTAVSFPQQDMILVNVPHQEEGYHEQFVMNTVTKAWCKFVGWHAEDFVVFDRNLYYCKGDVVYRAWKRTTDEYQAIDRGFLLTYPTGTSITHTARGAFNDWGSPHVKAPAMFLPIVESNRGQGFSAGVDTDFNLAPFPDALVQVETGIGRWSSARWGISRWGSSTRTVRQWLGASAWPGRWIAGKVKVQSNLIGSFYELALGSDVPLIKWFGSVVRYVHGDTV